MHVTKPAVAEARDQGAIVLNPTTVKQRSLSCSTDPSGEIAGSVKYALACGGAGCAAALIETAVSAINRRARLRTNALLPLRVQSVIANIHLFELDSKNHAAIN